MRSALLALALIVSACAAPTSTTDVELTSGYRVQLHNAGAITLRSIRVTTGANVPPITIAELAPGARSGFAAVSMLHEHPIVSLTANGRSTLHQPIEGFSGYNAQVARGSYVIGLDYDADTDRLSVRVAAVRENGS